MANYEMMGKILRQKRIEKGLSQEELAKRCGYKSRSSINKLELSRIIPTTKLEVIAKALDTTPLSLMGWDFEPTVPCTITIDENSVSTYTVDLSEDEYKLIVKMRESKKADLIEQVFTYTEALLTMEKFSPLSSKRGTEADK